MISKLTVTELEKLQTRLKSDEHKLDRKIAVLECEKKEFTQRLQILGKLITRKKAGGESFDDLKP